MAPGRPFVIVFLSALALQVNARHINHYRHEAVEVQRRQVESPSLTSTVTVQATTEDPILTYITPSPGAAPIAITEESQLVTSYVPEYTLCELPPQAVFPVTALPTLTTMTAPWRNYSISIPEGNGTCTTIYSPTQTMVCATTLTGLVQKYTVSDCAQDITFSTEYGFVLASPTANVSGVASPTGAAVTPAPVVQRLTTYYLAPWQAVTAGIAPEEVALKVCAKYANGTEECIRQYEVWHTSMVTQSATRTKSVNISTTIHGISQIIVETYVANVTEALTTFSLATEMEFEYATEVIDTSRESASASTAPTSYLTVTVEEATPAATATPAVTSVTADVTEGDFTTTRTSTIRTTRTTTIYDIPATTVTLPTILDDDQTLPTPTNPVDWASHLGIQTARKE